MDRYFEYKGVYFLKGTPLKLCDFLITAKENNTRVVLDFGDIKTNESWGEMFDTTGRIGKSTGDKPVLILLHNSRSTGGGMILTDAIISVKSSIGKVELYKNIIP